VKIDGLNFHCNRYVSHDTQKEAFISLTLPSDLKSGLATPEAVPEPTSRSSMKYQPVSSSLFTGREDFLNTLEGFFTDQGPGEHLRREYLLYGMGGAGKTQIALRFTEKHSQRLVYVGLSLVRCD